MDELKLPFPWCGSGILWFLFTNKYAWKTYSWISKCLLWPFVGFSGWVKFTLSLCSGRSSFIATAEPEELATRKGCLGKSIMQRQQWFKVLKGDRSQMLWEWAVNIKHEFCLPHCSSIHQCISWSEIASKRDYGRIPPQTGETTGPRDWEQETEPFTFRSIGQGVITGSGFWGFSIASWWS